MRSTLGLLALVAVAMMLPALLALFLVVIVVGAWYADQRRKGGIR